MKKYVIFSIVLIQCFLSVSGQVTFDTGYIIDNSGIKTECLIKNYDWWFNPKDIQYKLSEDGPIVSASIDSIREFGVDNYARFVRAAVKIDRSPTEIGMLSTTSAPLWSEETLFLRELTCGKACLWIYAEEKSWFFYTLNDSHPEQLVYKKYIAEGTNKIHENAGFRQQLYVNMQNENTKNANFEILQYREAPLVRYFKRYNSDFEEKAKPELKKPEREVFNAKIVGSLNYSRLCITNPVIPRKYDFGGKTNWMGGLELEYFLPYNRNTTSILFAPTFEHYKNSKTFYEHTPSHINANIDMLTVHFPVGVRYSLYLNNDMRFFFDAYYNDSYFYINKNDGFIYVSSVLLDIKESNNFIFGGGFTYKKWQIELKYHTNRDLFCEYSAWGSGYTKVVLSGSYKLFSVRK